ncbi:peptide chain release factor N(5)-glutamine methyltransferase [Glutamicibacter sp. PS]|uniref:peptide chain release factor N(5)-glutamine methyltransferase n=1 Tax=Glutamicibacter sp. PS TaxID=3075634 RepID=UPI0028413ABA|nr:peptide chain release factor N(5)-glutamine methyltransferase [Glutamicibacter sp. PS]MDR4533155.1 peptide chain release factor N(5)-glutamine methyltransferase [Glutamicibacter sp. PS]
MDRSIAALRRAASTTLAAAGVPSPAVDARILLCFATRMESSELELAALHGTQLPDADVELFEQLVRRRAERVPLQHLTGRAAFRYLELAVGPGVFIPRPETETVVQVGLDFLRQAALSAPRCIDLCSGSGAIAAALASELPAAQVWAVELSDAAISYTRQNCEPHGVQVLHTDATQLPAELEGGMDLVISNPPYIPPGAVPREVEVHLHDPQMALYGLGEDGLQIPRAITAQALRLLRPGGLFVMEHAEVQQRSAAEMLLRAGFTAVRGHEDLTQRARATSGRKPE